MPPLSVIPLPSGTRTDTYASSRSIHGVLRKGNVSSLPRKIPSEWFFWASRPAVTTRPKPNGYFSDGSFLMLNSAMLKVKPAS